MSSFLGLILERIEYDTFERLIEEGRDPIELLSYKYSNVPSEIIHKVVSIDPTKKKSYSQWLLSHWDDESDTIVNNLKNGRIEKLFQHYKEHNDIQIKDCPSVEEGLEKFVPEVDTVLTKSSNPTTLLMNNGWTEEVDSDLANDFDIVFDDDDWIIAVPNTYEADCKLGENMNWCTAGGRSDFYGGRSYFDQYLRNSGGKYYVNFDMSRGESRLGKDYPFTRYQFHFESRQFMDKNDDPVELSEIDMPESAIEFYESEGYDASDFENEEARWERYNNQRYESTYTIADELYLNIEYDDEYNWEEPQADTDFYLFDYDDDRDPISWDEIANPFVNGDEIFTLKDEEHDLFIFNTKYGDEDEYLLAIKENSGYRKWKAYKIKNYIQLPDGIGVFAIGCDYNHSNNYTFFSHNGSVPYKFLNAQNCENMFINEQCTNVDRGKWDGIFIETVQDGYHSLFRILYDNMNCDLDCIVKRDDPTNGESFIMNEQGIIEGQFRKYRVYNDEDYEQDDTYHNYDLEQELENGDYVISTLVKVERDYSSQKHEEQFNILKRGTNAPLLPVWFDKFIGYGQGLYLIEKNVYTPSYDPNGKQIIGTTRGDRFAYFDENGKQIGEWYEKYLILDKRGYCIGQDEKTDVKCDLISAQDRSVIARFKKLSTMTPVNNKILAICDDGVTRGYDYIERQFCYPQFSTMVRVSTHYDCFCCELSDGGGKVLFDFPKQQIMVTNIARIDWLDRMNDIFKLTKTDGKFNAYDAEHGKILLPNDVDGIEGINGCILFYLNNRYYMYHVKDDKMQLNPNGFNLPFETNDGYGYIAFGDGQYRLIFGVSRYDGCHFNKWADMTTRQQYYELSENTPQEVWDMYYQITGEQPQQSPQEEEAYAVAEQFKRFVNRINEVEKLKYNDIID